MTFDQGREIYEIKKKRFENKGRNTEGWIEKKRGKGLKRIVDHFGGEKIPYSCFCDSKKICLELFNSENDRNYIYYTIFKGLDLKWLKEESDGLRYFGPL